MEDIAKTMMEVIKAIPDKAVAEKIWAGVRGRLGVKNKGDS